MKIEQEKCTGCSRCVPYCNVGAISIRQDEKKAFIDQAVCVECRICYRNRVCPQGAIVTTPLESYGDIFKHVLSDPTETTAETGVPGRGTEEAKTNDVTGRFKKSEVGIAIDMGRPGIGCYMRDVEKVAMAVAAAGVIFPGPEHTPLTKIMADRQTGALKKEYLGVHLLSIIIEGTCRIERFPAVLKALEKVEKEIDTVFSLGVIARVDEQGRTPVLDALEDCGWEKPTRGKVNVGLGRPLSAEE